MKRVFWIVMMLPLLVNAQHVDGNNELGISRDLMPQTVADQFSVVINELMVDPEPAIGLPTCEYLELFNRSSLAVRMHDWKLTIGQSTKTLPDFTIEPRGYYLVTSTGHDTVLTRYGKVATVPGFSLLNGGTTVTLKNNKNAVIHTVTYNDNWYNNKIKENGGWSLEQIDSDNPCQSTGNWSASINADGGTPGSVNSIKGNNPDTWGPAIEYLNVTGESTVQVFFTEPMDSLSLLGLALYSADNGLGHPVKLALKSPGYSSVSLIFDQHFNDAVTYTLSLNGSLKDCSGNEIEGPLTATFAIPSPVEANDIIINELLFDPLTSGTEFLEIYNRSLEVKDLGELWISTRDNTTGELEGYCQASSSGRLMFPGDYMVLSRDSENVKTGYFTSNPLAFSTLNSFPSLLNSGGKVVLSTINNVVIDEFTYSEDLHFALLNSTKGVSLERVDPNRPTGDQGNWHSASEASGFATPGYLNSQFMQLNKTTEEVTIQPLTFSPDSDGIDDQLFINCLFTEPGYAVTIRVFDSNGRHVRFVANNQLAGTSTVFSWDGTTDSSEKAPVGIYVIYTEIYNLAGKVKHFKHAAVLALKT